MTMPRVRSAKARDTMKKLVAPLSLEVVLTAKMMSALPRMTVRQTMPSGMREPTTRGFSKSTSSSLELQLRSQWYLYGKDISL